MGDLTRRGDDRISLLGRKPAEVLVDLSARRFQQTECPNLVAFQSSERNREVLHGALGLSLPQGVNRDPDLAHGVVLDSVLAFSAHVFLLSFGTEVVVREAGRRQWSPR